MELVIKELGDFSEISEEVKKLQFCIEFNECIDGLIPDCVTHLEFGFYFNQPVNNLPNSITHLNFGYCFNQSVNNLPSSITHLEIGGKFNKSVESRGKNKTLFCYFPDGEDRKKEKILFLSFYLLIYQRV